MRVSLRPALAGMGVAAAALSAVVTLGVVKRSTLNRLDALTQEHLTRQTLLAAEELGHLRGLPPDTVVRRLAEATGYRVSFLDSDQVLFADSDLPSPESSAPAVDARPEVGAALGRVTGMARRTSLTDGRAYLFNARRVPWAGRSVVLRLGVPAGPVDSEAQSVAIVAALLTSGFVVLLAALLWVGGGRMSVELAGVRTSLRRIGSGESGGGRLPLSAVVEVAQVQAAVNRLSVELEEQLGAFARELDEMNELLDQVAEGLLALTDDARVLRINPAGRVLLGVADVAPFSPVGSIVREPELRDLLEASVIQPEIRAEVDLGGRQLQVTTRRTKGGGAVVLLMDVSEVRRLEAVRTDFVANASHELKTPLTVIRGAAETVMDSEVPDELRVQFLRSIQSNTVRLQRLVDDLLDLSRFESGAWEPDRTQFDVRTMAERVWRELEAKARDKDVQFLVSGDGTAVGDESAIYQIFQNLFDNAIRYVDEEDGEILVEILPRSGLVEVGVLDNGAGIPASALPRIFERFYRVDAARSRDEGGTGLGLSIVRHLVTTMGGEVWAESTLGVGTAVRFTLPQAAGGPRSPDRP